MKEELRRRRRFIASCSIASLMAIGLGLSHADGLRTRAAHNVAGGAASSKAPNLLLIMTDDVGFAASSTFGGPIPTPTFDALAAEGLRYNNFHTTALCSPTRAALLTGRNSHAVGMGNITEGGGADPGYTTVIPKSAATIARVVRDHGYRTAVFGKYHLIPKWELSAVGPFDHWPTSMGFDYFYGFEPAMTDQFTPNLIENTRVIAPPGGPDYFLERDLADRAVHWLREVRAAARDQPFFMYYAPGTANAPVQAPNDWIGRYRGRFDRGWDVERDETLARQKQLGVVPPDAVLTPRATGVPAWDSLSADEKRVAARLMEVYAAARPMRTIRSDVCWRSFERAGSTRTRSSSTYRETTARRRKAESAAISTTTTRSIRSACARRARSLRPRGTCWRASRRSVGATVPRHSDRMDQCPQHPVSPVEVRRVQPRRTEERDGHFVASRHSRAWRDTSTVPHRDGHCTHGL